MIPIIIISGFLGAGKTTFIEHLVKEHDPSEKLLVIENDFGETSLDAVQLEHTGATVREVTAGCICCDLQGSFKKVLLDIIQQDDIHAIYIEPSGISKLSEIINMCSDDTIKEKAYLHGTITIVNTMQAPMGIKTFGQFYNDQIMHCDAIFLSHAEDVQQTELTTHMIRKIAPHTPIHKESWSDLSLHGYIKRLYHCNENTLQDDNPFMSHTFKGLRELTEGQWSTILDGLPETVLRVKGIVPTPTGPMAVQYTPHHCELTPTENTDYNLVMIGTEFDIPLIHTEVCVD